MTVIHITDYENMEYVLIKHKMFTYAVAGPGFYHRYMHLKTFAYPIGKIRQCQYITITVI